MDNFQQECVEVFQRAASVFNLPPSVGQIYGLLFSTQESLSLEEIVERLRASRGGTFQGLRWLREMGAIHSETRDGKRCQYFRAELNLRKLAGAFLGAKIEPHLENGAEYLKDLREQLSPANSSTGEFQRERYKQMERWHGFISDVLPVIRMLADKF